MAASAFWGRIAVIAGLLAPLPGGAAAPTRSAAAGAFPGPIHAEVLKVVDGDTLSVRALIWIGQELKTTVRLDGVDTPELRARCPEEREKARAARDLARRLVGDGPVVLTEIEPDKYGGRVRARVRTAKGLDLAQALIKAGLARPYKGEKRAGWCA